MKNNQIIKYGPFFCITAVVVLSILLALEISLNHLVFKALFFFGITSVILSNLYILVNFCSTCQAFIEKLISYLGFLLIILSLPVFFGLFNFSQFWHILVGGVILHLLLIEIQLLGWNSKKQSIVTKITFLLSLVSNLFLACVFIFKISMVNIAPLIFIVGIVSILSLLYGVFFFQAKLLPKGQSL